MPKKLKLVVQTQTSTTTKSAPHSAKPDSARQSVAIVLEFWDCL
ncbi:hypothetical protein [Helicobacter sp.]